MIVVNPGSTSTKLAVYRGAECLAAEVINHPKEELARFAHVADQYEFRRDAVMAVPRRARRRAGPLSWPWRAAAG